MSIFDPFSTGVRAYLRTGRRARSRIAWDRPLESALYLKHDANGRVCVVVLQDLPDFAEFDPRRKAADARLFDTQDYVLEILELPSKQVSLPL